MTTPTRVLRLVLAGLVERVLDRLLERIGFGPTSHHMFVLTFITAVVVLAWLLLR